jgi:magnesium transporter
MADDILFLTELLGFSVYDLKGRRLGLVKDAAIVPLIHPSRVDRFLVGGGWAWLTVRHDQVRSISLDGIYLKDEQLTPYHSDEYMLRLVRDLLDQQIIDGQGRKVVRVTDVTFQIEHEPDNDLISIIDVDIGLRSMFRRLAQGVLPRTLIRRLQTVIPPNSIRWEHCSIIEADPQRRLRLNISNKLLERMHPADLADIVEDLSPDDREAIFETIDSEVAAEALSEIEPDVQASILESLETEKAADIVEEMSPHEAADVLAELEQQTSEDILEEMEHEPKAEVQELLEYHENSAGGLMNTEYVALPESATVAEALEALKTHEEILETLNTVFLVDAEEHLKASVPLARLFTATGSAPLRELAGENLIHVDVEEKQNRITEIFDKYNLLTLPVTDETGKLAGVITADEVISLLREK